MADYRKDMLDFPTAFEIQRNEDLEHHPKCSQPAMLCDCGAVVEFWEAQRADG